jgi:hypothetical protein
VVTSNPVFVIVGDILCPIAEISPSIAYSSTGRAISEEEKISKYDSKYIQGEWSTRVSRRSRKRQGRLIAMQAALETRLYQKEKNKHRQNDPKKVGRGQRPKKEQRNSDSPSEYMDFVSKFPITLREFMPPELMDIPGIESLSCQVIQVLDDSAYPSHIAPTLPIDE